MHLQAQFGFDFFFFATFLSNHSCRSNCQIISVEIWDWKSKFFAIFFSYSYWDYLLYWVIMLLSFLWKIQRMISSWYMAAYMSEINPLKSGFGHKWLCAFDYSFIFARFCGAPCWQRQKRHKVSKIIQKSVLIRFKNVGKQSKWHIARLNGVLCQSSDGIVWANNDRYCAVSSLSELIAQIELEGIMNTPCSLEQKITIEQYSGQCSMIIEIWIKKIYKYFFKFWALNEAKTFYA